MKKGKLNEENESILSSESDLNSQLSYLRNEIFENNNKEKNYTSKVKESLSNNYNNNNNNNNSNKNYYYDLNKFTLDEINTPVNNNKYNHHHHPPSPSIYSSSLPYPQNNPQNNLQNNLQNNNNSSQYISYNSHNIPPQIIPQNSFNINPNNNTNNNNNNTSQYRPIQLRDTPVSRAVIETEQMGLRLTDEIQRLRSELKRCKETNNELNTTIQKYKSENDTFRIQQLETTQNLQQLTTANTKLTQDCERYKLELSTCNERCNLLDEKYNLIQEKLKSYINEKEATKEKYDFIQLESIRIKERNTELESKIQTLTKSLEHEKSTQQITQSNLLVAEEQVLKLTKGIEESRNECYSLRKQITDNGDGRSSLMTLLQERDVEIRRLTQFNHELNDKIEDRQNEIKQMKYRLENIERENENHSSDLIRIKQKKNKIEQEKSSLERQINAMEEQRTYLMNEKSKLEEQLLEYKHKVTVLQDTINHLESSNSTMSSSYGQKLQTIRTQFQSTTNMLEQIQVQRLQQENTIQDLRAQLTTLEEKYSTLKRLNKQLLTATDTYESILKRRDLEA